MTPDYYYYLNQSDTYKVEGTDDRSDFSETLVSTSATPVPREPFHVTNKETEAQKGAGTLPKLYRKLVKRADHGAKEWLSG